ncbi:hypothetical protein Vretimale_1920 [Volvox reticuliferus]|uniref:Uncharacterized protein n=1 Tax=Volvox reticuliferus TaxID=1737510 RepID=A0A8J4D5C6_9CHLO|nr:hypothetical protein Vretifemale_17305 [Volvox reticuliferus]GIL96013.1 hypothetical protein Vretimale_1920 [Volvox reticuliferus]
MDCDCAPSAAQGLAESRPPDHGLCYGRTNETGGPPAGDKPPAMSKMPETSNASAGNHGTNVAAPATAAAKLVHGAPTACFGGMKNHSLENQANPAGKRLGAPLKAISVMCSPPPPEQLAAKRLRELDRSRQGAKSAKRSKGLSEGRSSTGSPEGGSDVGEPTEREMGNDPDASRQATIYGVFHPDRYLNGEDCIDYQGNFITRSKFEKLGGSLMAKWYRSIRVVTTDEPLGAWLTRRGLPVLKGNPRNRRPAPAKDGHGNDTGGATARGHGNKVPSISTARSGDFSPARGGPADTAITTGSPLASAAVDSGAAEVGAAPATSKVGTGPRSASPGDGEDEAIVAKVAAAAPCAGRGDSAAMAMCALPNSRVTPSGDLGIASAGGASCFGSLVPPPAAAMAPHLVDLSLAPPNTAARHDLQRRSPSNSSQISSEQFQISILSYATGPAAATNLAAAGVGLEGSVSAAAALPMRFSAPTASVVPGEPPSADSGGAVIVAGGSVRSVASAPVHPMPQMPIFPDSAVRVPMQSPFANCTGSPLAPRPGPYTSPEQDDAAWLNWAWSGYDEAPENGALTAPPPPPPMLANGSGTLRAPACDEAARAGSGQNQALTARSGPYESQLQYAGSAGGGGGGGGSAAANMSSDWPYRDPVTVSLPSACPGQHFSFAGSYDGSAGYGVGQGSHPYQHRSLQGTSAGLTGQLGSGRPPSLSQHASKPLNRIELVKMELMRGARGDAAHGAVTATCGGALLASGENPRDGLHSRLPSAPPPSHTPLPQPQPQLRQNMTRSFEARVEQLMRSGKGGGRSCLGGWAPGICAPPGGGGVGSTALQAPRLSGSSSGGIVSAVFKDAQGVGAMEQLPHDCPQAYLLQGCGGATGDGTAAVAWRRGMRDLDCPVVMGPAAVTWNL